MYFTAGRYYLVYWKDENAVAALPEKDMVTTATIGEMANVRVGKAVYPAQVVAIGELIACVHSCWGLYAHMYDCACLLLHSYYSHTYTYRDKRRNGFSREKVSDEITIPTPQERNSNLLKKITVIPLWKHPKNKVMHCVHY